MDTLTTIDNATQAEGRDTGACFGRRRRRRSCAHDVREAARHPYMCAIYVCHLCVPYACHICVPHACQSCSGGGKKVSPCRVIVRSACPQRCVHRAPAKAMPPTEACHQQRHVTNRGMSPTEACHQQRYVTNRGMSRTEACHQQRHVTNRGTERAQGSMRAARGHRVGCAYL